MGSGRVVLGCSRVVAVGRGGRKGEGGRGARGCHMPRWGRGWGVWHEGGGATCRGGGVGGPHDKVDGGR